MWKSTPQRVSFAISGKSANRVRSTTCIVAPSIATASTCVGQRRSISFSVGARSFGTGGRISGRLAFSPA